MKFEIKYKDGATNIFLDDEPVKGVIRYELDQHVRDAFPTLTLVMIEHEELLVSGEGDVILDLSQEFTELLIKAGWQPPARK